MADTIKQYASGFRTLPTGYDPKYSTIQPKIELVKDGDPQVDELRKTLQMVRVGNLSSKDKLAFIDCAKRLFGDVDRFMEYNLQYNKLVHGEVLDFLVDTLEFINGDNRSLSIETWGNYLDQKAKTPAKVPDDRRINVSYAGNNYIEKWLRRPNGFSDLASTVIIMFGLKLTDPKNIQNGII